MNVWALAGIAMGFSGLGSCIFVTVVGCIYSRDDQTTLRFNGYGWVMLWTYFSGLIAASTFAIVIWLLRHQLGL